MSENDDAAALYSGDTLTRRIDVHHHFFSREYLAAWGEEKLGSISAAGKIVHWSTDVSLDLMEQAGVATALLSVSSPGFPYEGSGSISRLCRSTNEFAARMVIDFPGRFGMFANLPLPDIDEAITEIDYCLDTLKADGVALFTNYHGVYLGDPALDPVFEHLSRRNAVVFVHPITPPGGKTLPSVSESTLDYPFETTRAIVNVLAYGTPLRFPGVRFIFSHGGGAVPYLAGRIATFTELSSTFRQRGFAGVMPGLADFWFDITQSANPAAFAALRKIVPGDKLLFGTDVPFARKEQVGLTVSTLPTLGLSEAEMKALGRTNAAKLFPRFA